MTDPSSWKRRLLLVVPCVLASAAVVLGLIVWVQNSRILERVRRLEARQNIWNIGAASKAYMSQHSLGSVSAPAASPAADVSAAETGGLSVDETLDPRESN